TADQKMIFSPGGLLVFQGGMEFFNPANWELDTAHEELILTFPQTDIDKLQIFKLYIGQGVKAFYPAQKQVVYHFDTETAALNIGGWDYSKVPQNTAEPTPPEPVLK